MDPREAAGSIDPDCRDGKHSACPGWAFNPATDTTGPCACPCHT